MINLEIGFLLGYGHFFRLPTMKEGAKIHTLTCDEDVYFDYFYYPPL